MPKNRHPCPDCGIPCTSLRCRGCARLKYMLKDRPPTTQDALAARGACPICLGSRYCCEHAGLAGKGRVRELVHTCKGTCPMAAAAV